MHVAAAAAVPLLIPDQLKFVWRCAFCASWTHVSHLLVDAAVAVVSLVSRAYVFSGKYFYVLCMSVHAVQVMPKSAT